MKPAEGTDGTGLPILYLDDAIVVINKPSGLLVHRSPIDRHETRFAVQMVRDQIGRRVYPVHRLDKGTSGALAFALDREAARSLATAFSSNHVVKTYLAIVRGWPAEGGEIDHPLAAVQDEYAPSLDSGPKASRTSFRRLETGRTHQIRVHLRAIDHPVVGDVRYGGSKPSFPVDRPWLHAAALRLDHPITGEEMAFDSPLPPDLRAGLDQLR